MEKNKTKILLNKSYAKESLEYQLIEYLNADPLSIVENPVNIISKNLHVNTSSLARTVKKFGFKNYKSFRNFVIKEIIKNENYLANSVFQNSNELFKDSIVSNILTIKETIEINDNEKFNEIIDEIINAKKIFLFGIGFASFICQDLTKYFEICNINCYNTINFYDAFQFASCSVGNTWIIISIKLQTKEMLFLLEELVSKKNNKIIVITANYTSCILNKVDYVLKLKTNDYIKEEMFNLNLKIALTALTNLIILKIINRTGFELNKKNFNLIK